MAETKRFEKKWKDGVWMKTRFFAQFLLTLLFLFVSAACASASPYEPVNGPANVPANELAPYIWQPLSEVGPGNAYIPAGTVINCELITPLLSKQNSVGQSVMFRTIENLNVANVPVIRYGSAGKAFVSIARKAGYFGTGGTIEMRPVSLRTIAGIEVPVVFGVNLSKYDNMKDVDTSSIPPGLRRTGGEQAGAGFLSAVGISNIIYGFNVAERNWYWQNYASSGSMVTGGLFLLFAGAMIKGADQQIPPFTRFQVTVVKDVDLGFVPEGIPTKTATKVPLKNYATSNTARISGNSVDSRAKVALIFVNNAKTTYDDELNQIAMESLTKALNPKYEVVPGTKYVDLLQKSGIVDITTAERSDINEVFRGEDFAYIVYAELQPFVRKQTMTTFTTGMDMTAILPLKIIDPNTGKYLYTGKMTEFARDSTIITLLGYPIGFIGNKSVAIMALRVALEKAAVVIGTRLP